MKIVYGIILICLSLNSICQDRKVISLRELNESEASVEKSELFSNGMLGLPKKILLYNIFFELEGERGLITITLLPALDNGEIKYELVSAIEDKTLGLEDLTDEWSLRFQKTHELLKTGHRPIDWEYSKHYLKSDDFVIYEETDDLIYKVKSPVLLEFYKIESSISPFELGNDYGVINISSREYAQSDYENDLNDYAFRAAAFEKAGAFFLDHIEKGSRYFFWSIPLMVNPQREFHQGIGKFVFSESEGIIEGRFRFYFDPFVRKYLEQSSLDTKEVDYLIGIIDYSFAKN
ncbi:hypothetical protein [Roseivirga sp.]|uniref:hypothetical protein n=1 Tax=Roseivirga sp. TaxID=1964215 RepID=UPI003B5230EA